MSVVMLATGAGSSTPNLPLSLDLDLRKIWLSLFSSVRVAGLSKVGRSAQCITTEGVSPPASITQEAATTATPMALETSVQIAIAEWLGIHTTNHSWTSYLQEDERQEMALELALTLLVGVLADNWEPYHEAVEAWHATADVLSDPMLTARLLAAGDPLAEVPLARP
ncbi:MAG TPA: hypothetical protein VFE42_17425 [Chloroflexota bacterium]|nr:hypothetical protein [Chloroflexota bacterium]